MQAEATLAQKRRTNGTDSGWTHLLATRLPYNDERWAPLRYVAIRRCGSNPSNLRDAFDVVYVVVQTSVDRVNGPCTSHETHHPCGRREPPQLNVIKVAGRVVFRAATRP